MKFLNKFRYFILSSLLLLCGSFQQQNTPSLVDVTTLDSRFSLDIRYATSNNFLKEPLYDCAKCLLLPQVAEALNNANYYFCDRGFQIQIFDCYRPLSVQKKMWAKVPNPIYVADPAKGSVHNRGAAVDITLRKLDGSYIDMGTDYDYFGRKAHIDNFNLSEEILNNRKILQDGMNLFGFSTIQSEWWHFNYPTHGAPIIDIPFDCRD